MLFGQIFALIIIGTLLVVWLKEWIWLPIAVVVLLYVVRWLADLWWWGKDKGKW